MREFYVKNDDISPLIGVLCANLSDFDRYFDDILMIMMMIVDDFDDKMMLKTVNYTP